MIPIPKSRYEQVNNFFRGYSGQRLLEEGYNLDSEGLWEVRDSGDVEGYNTRFMGYFEGRLEDVVDFLMDDPKFVGYGGGGSIRPYEHKVTQVLPRNIREIQLLLDEEQRAKKELEETQARLVKLQREIESAQQARQALHESRAVVKKS